MPGHDRGRARGRAPALIRSAWSPALAEELGSGLEPGGVGAGRPLRRLRGRARPLRAARWRRPARPRPSWSARSARRRSGRPSLRRCTRGPPVLSTVNVPVQRSLYGSGGHGRLRPSSVAPTSRYLSTALRMSCPSAKMSASTTTSSPTVRLIGNGPPSIAGRIALDDHARGGLAATGPFSLSVGPRLHAVDRTEP